MYRLFCNTRTLSANNFSEYVLAEHVDYTEKSLELAEKTRQWLEDETIENLDFGDSDGVDVALAMKAVFEQAPAAGGLVIIDNQFVAIERKGIADIPKGHIEKGESPEVAALREVEEETVITNLEIIRELPATWHCYRPDNQWTIKKTSWYLMHTSSDRPFVPQTEEGITKVYLVGKDQLEEFEKHTFDSLKSLVAEVSPYL